jgi:predicted O-methyltransferase YrrM
MTPKIKNKLLKIYYKIRESFYSENDLKADFDFNIKTLKKNNFLIEGFEKKLNAHNIDVKDRDISWHYILFYLICQEHEYKNFLEIGTFDAKFINHLSSYFPNKILTIDLKSNQEEFINSYGRNIKNDFIEKRNLLLDKENIAFQEMDSFYLLDKFYLKKSFDLIWVDGDHKNPQVTFDIISSLKLLNDTGKLLIDDILKSKSNRKYTSNESYETLQNLEERGIIKYELYLKRIAKSNSHNKKYIAVIQKII